MGSTGMSDFGIKKRFDFANIEPEKKDLDPVIVVNTGDDEETVTPIKATSP
jgi:hypothetical protein